MSRSNRYLVNLREAVQEWADSEAECRRLDEIPVVGEWEPLARLDEMKRKRQASSKRGVAWEKVTAALGELEQTSMGRRLVQFQSEAIAHSQVSHHYGENLTGEALGLCGEVGGLAALASKVEIEEDGVPTDEDRDKIAHALGEVMIRTAVLCAEMGLTMEQVAEAALAKKMADKRPGLGD